VPAYTVSKDADLEQEKEKLKDKIFELLHK
jgi:hypothetical protein